jgi:hypothetical protein
MFGTEHFFIEKSTLKGEWLARHGGASLVISALRRWR